MACPRGKHPKKNKQKRDVRRTMPTGPGKFGAPCPSQIKSKTQAQPEGGFWSSDLTRGNGEEGPKTPRVGKASKVRSFALDLGAPLDLEANPSIPTKLDTLHFSRNLQRWIDRFNGHHLQINQLYFGPSRPVVGLQVGKQREVNHGGPYSRSKRENYATRNWQTMICCWLCNICEIHCDRSRTSNTRPICFGQLICIRTQPFF